MTISQTAMNFSLFFSYVLKIVVPEESMPGFMRRSEEIQIWDI